MLAWFKESEGGKERERASSMYVCAQLSGDAPTTAATLPASSHLQCPAPVNQTALREARQVLSVSNVFHYKCSTIR